MALCFDIVHMPGPHESNPYSRRLVNKAAVKELTSPAGRMKFWYVHIK